MGARQGLDSVGAAAGQLDADDALVGLVLYPFDKQSGLCAVDQLDHAVMAQEEVIGNLPDRRRLRPMAADREEQLVLGGRQPNLSGLVLTPSLEATQTITEGEQSGEVVVPQMSASCCHIVSR